MLRIYKKRNRQEGPKEKVQKYWSCQVKHQQKRQGACSERCRRPYTESSTYRVYYGGVQREHV